MSDDPTRELVRAVTHEVVARLGSASPEVIETVVSEVLAATAASPPSDDGLAERDGGTPEATFDTPRGARLTLAPAGPAPSIDFCMACVEQERSRSRTRAVLTTTGKNTRGIVARVTGRIADLGGDILDISQTLVSDYFTMIIVVDVGSLSVSFAEFQEAVQATARDMGLAAMVMHEDVMSALHRV